MVPFFFGQCCCSVWAYRYNGRSEEAAGRALLSVRRVCAALEGSASIHRIDTSMRDAFNSTVNLTALRGLRAGMPRRRALLCGFLDRAAAGEFPAASFVQERGGTQNGHRRWAGGSAGHRGAEISVLTQRAWLPARRPPTHTISTPTSRPARSRRECVAVTVEWPPCVGPGAARERRRRGPRRRQHRGYGREPTAAPSLSGRSSV